MDIFSPLRSEMKKACAHKPAQASTITTLYYSRSLIILIFPFYLVNKKLTVKKVPYMARQHDYNAYLTNSLFFPNDSLVMHSFP